jgi:hypothetical protein
MIAVWTAPSRASATEGIDLSEWPLRAIVKAAGSLLPKPHLCAKVPGRECQSPAKRRQRKGYVSSGFSLFASLPELGLLESLF